jgi:hypothetical protein
LAAEDQASIPWPALSAPGHSGGSSGPRVCDDGRRPDQHFPTNTRVPILFLISNLKIRRTLEHSENKDLDMSRPAAITAVALEKILGFLAPLFLTSAQCDLSTATAVARELLDSYGARTNREVRLAALTIAFSFGALDSLGRSVAVDLSVNQILRLRGNANSLHRAAHKSEEALDRLHRAEAGPAQEEPVEDLPASTELPDLVAFTRPVPPVSRQQRRAAERQAEKTRLRQQEHARLAERAAARMPAPRAA